MISSISFEDNIVKFGVVIAQTPGILLFLTLLSSISLWLNRFFLWFTRPLSYKLNLCCTKICLLEERTDGIKPKVMYFREVPPDVHNKSAAPVIICTLEMDVCVGDCVWIAEENFDYRPTEIAKLPRRDFIFVSCTSDDGCDAS